MGDLAVTVVQTGSSQPVSRPGDYAIVGFAGSAPTVSGWTQHDFSKTGGPTQIFRDHA